MNVHPWQPALDAQLAAFQLADELVRRDRSSELASGWNVDRALLVDATPYMWSREVTAAVLEASRSIPLDTCLNRWNLESQYSWWWFEEPLPYMTTQKVTSKERSPLRALAFGFLPVTMQPGTFPVGTQLDEIFRFGLPAVGWVDPPEEYRRYHIIPSQTFEWQENDTLQDLLNATRAFHIQLYGPGGRWAHKPHTSLEEFMAATEGIARFMLAGLAWLKQRVLVERPEVVVRQRRREFERVVKRTAPAVRVISLRRVEARTEVATDELGGKREFSCRWVVDGHWRNQVCGPKRGDRRLTWVGAYVKGPEDKPLKSKVQKVYTVDR